MDTRIVLDTNVLISVLGWDAKPEACLKQVLHGPADGYIGQYTVRLTGCE